MRYFFLSALILAQFSCAPFDPDLVWHGDETFSPEERADIEEANSWMAEQVDQSSLLIVWDEPHEEPLRRVEGSHTKRRRIIRTRGDAGLFDNYTISLGTKSSVLRVLAAHEFGHQWKLGHTHGGVMDPNPCELRWVPQGPQAPLPFRTNIAFSEQASNCGIARSHE